MLLSSMVLMSAATLSVASAQQDFITLQRRDNKSNGGVFHAINRAKARHHFSSGPHRKRALTTVPLQNIEYDTEWYAPIVIANKTFNVILDTGSSDFWVRGSACTSTDKSCGPTSGISLGLSLTDPTVHSLSKNYVMEYGSGQEVVDLTAATATVAFSNHTFTGMYLGVSYEEIEISDPNDGIIGLAFPGICQICTTCSAAKTFVQTAALSNFSFYLSDSVDGDYGEFALNGANSSRYTPPFVYEAQGSALKNEFWNFPASSFSVGSKTSGTFSVKTFMVDTGTPVILMESNSATPINTAIGAGAYNSITGTYSIPCSVRTTGPPITFKMGSGNSYTISAKSYVMTNPVAPTTCFSAIVPVGNVPYMILGAPFLREYYSNFDVANSRMGFAKAIHP